MKRPGTGRLQFSIRHTLLLVTACAIGIAFYLAFIWKPPTDGIRAYEKAPAFYGRTARIGPNQIRIESIARNDRDGTIRIETGRGEPLDVAIPNKSSLISSAPWLDVAQIDLRPGGDAVEIIELRIFDHVSRELLNVKDPAFGWTVTSPNVLHLYGFGKPLPEKVDVWMRLHSYSADDAVHRLAPVIGASTQVGRSSVTVRRLQAGFKGWDSRSGFVEVEGEFHADCALELQWDKGDDETKYQIAAVTSDGERLVKDRYSVFSGSERIAMVPFSAPLETIDHFEIRPFGGLHRFFFDGVQLPAVKSKGQTAFAKPPAAQVKIAGAEMKAVANEFLPLDVRVQIHDGEFGSGSTAGSHTMTLLPHSGGPIDRGNSFSLIVDVRGIGGLPLNYRFRSGGNTAWLSEAVMKSSGGAKSFGPSRVLAERNYRTPLSTVDEFELRIGN